MSELGSHIQRVRNFSSRNAYIVFLRIDEKKLPIQVTSQNATQKDIKNHLSDKCRAGAEKKSLLKI